MTSWGQSPRETQYRKEDRVSEKRYVVPEGMLAAFKIGFGSESGFILPEIGPQTMKALEAALKWQAETPRVPNASDLKEFRTLWDDSWSKTQAGNGDFFAWALTEWIRRMYLAPEPQGGDWILKDIICHIRLGDYGDDEASSRLKYLFSPDTHLAKPSALNDGFERECGDLLYDPKDGPTKIGRNEALREAFNRGRSRK